MARKEKLVVAGKVRFISVNSSTPDEPRGYVPSSSRDSTEVSLLGCTETKKGPKELR